MKLLLPTAFAICAASVFALAVPDISSELFSAANGTTPNDSAFEEWFAPTKAAGDENDDLWTLSVARGTKLLQGMKGSDEEAASLYGLDRTAESPFDGDLIDKLREWGYNDDNDALAKQTDPECNFYSRDGHMLKGAFADLGIRTKSKNQGGPNQCFSIEHFNMDTDAGKALLGSPVGRWTG